MLTWRNVHPIAFTLIRPAMTRARVVVIEPHARSIKWRRRHGAAGTGLKFAHLKGRSYAGNCALTDWQRNGRAEDVVGVVMSLGSDEPFGIATIAFRRSFRVVPA